MPDEIFGSAEVPLDPIERIEQLLTMLEDAVGVANKRGEQIEALQVRVRELEANRDLFQQRRDEAIRGEERKSTLLDRVLKEQPFAVEVEKYRPEPGDFMIVRMVDATTPEAIAGRRQLLAWLKTKYREVTFAFAAPGAPFEIEQMTETQLRTLGLISAVRVDAGTQELEAAFGAHQAALKKCRDTLNDEVERARPDAPSEREMLAAELVGQLDELLKAEIVRPPPAPAEEDLDGKDAEGGTPT